MKHWLLGKTSKNQSFIQDSNIKIKRAKLVQ